MCVCVCHHQVGVEHLIRDINDPSTSILARQIKQKAEGLSGLAPRLHEIRRYLEAVVAGRLPVNNQIIYNLQDIFNLLPNLNVDSLVHSMMVKTNDVHLSMYLAALVRSVIALHELLMNKTKYRDMDDVLDRSVGMAAAAASASRKFLPKYSRICFKSSHLRQ